MDASSAIELAASPAPMLSKRYGKETVNYFSDSPLNRLSFLRTNHTFLHSALPHARYLLFNALDPLTDSRTNLSFLTYDQVRHLLPPNLYEDDDKEVVAGYDSTVEEGAEVVFLGVDEEGRLDVGKGEEKERFRYKEYEGTPYFAVDVSRAVSERRIGTGILTEGGRMWRRTKLDMDVVPLEAGILAHARSILDWNTRNKFCAACGNKTISTQSGTKRVCPPNDKATGPRPQCLSRSGVHNIAFPRTDPTVIMAVINHTGDKMLLGRQKSWPPHFYSTLAGFCEPGESLSSTVRREAWEESGIRISHVHIHSSQPWPYPSNLMIGCIAETFPDGETIHLKHDEELEDARWFGYQEVKDAVERKGQTTGLEDRSKEGKREGALRLPPSTAIAHQLIAKALELMEGWNVEGACGVGKGRELEIGAKI